ncbi:hypothetical protein QJQ45_012308 [Haematococcus lacustris]|nr:hypothetical protein QJQ45_012308 [Haematococcus lacustris]
MSLVAQCLRGSGPVPRSKSRFRLKARENKSDKVRAAHVATVHASAGPRTPPAKQREERRAEWNTQRRQESRWRPLELCFWPDQGALPAKGKEYPGLGYKRLRDKPPKAQQQQAPPI